jgi:hypothetical protein
LPPSTITSPRASSGQSSSTVSSVMRPAGTISQTKRGAGNRCARSTIEDAASSTPSPASAAEAAGAAS